MWSVKDLETGSIMETGRNSDTKEEAIDTLWDWWVGREPALTDEEIEESVKKYGKLCVLNSAQYRFFEHNEPIDEEVELVLDEEYATDPNVIRFVMNEATAVKDVKTVCSSNVVYGDRSVISELVEELKTKKNQLEDVIEELKLAID